MRNTLLIRGVMTLAIVGCVCITGPAQEKAKGHKKMPSQEVMMKRWQEAMTPGDAHKQLEALVGSWDADVKVWMNGPGTEPTVSKGTSEQTMSLGGRFLQQQYSGEMMGQPMNGIGYTGYDNFKKKYVAFWIDNMGTAMSHMEGTIDKEGKTITMWGTMDEPSTGEKGKKVKYVTRVIDKDKNVFEIYDVTSWGEKQPTMVITYTRKKS
jgi:Protein of unknown function (DUF1579)